MFSWDFLLACAQARCSKRVVCLIEVVELDIECRWEVCTELIDNDDVEQRPGSITPGVCISWRLDCAACTFLAVEDTYPGSKVCLPLG